MSNKPIFIFLFLMSCHHPDNPTINFNTNKMKLETRDSFYDTGHVYDIQNVSIQSYSGQLDPDIDTIFTHGPIINKWSGKSGCFPRHNLKKRHKSRKLKYNIYTGIVDTTTIYTRDLEPDWDSIWAHTKIISIPLGKQLYIPKVVLLPPITFKVPRTPNYNHAR